MEDVNWCSRGAGACTDLCQTNQREHQSAYRGQKIGACALQICVSLWWFIDLLPKQAIFLLFPEKKKNCGFKAPVHIIKVGGETTEGNESYVQRLTRHVHKCN